MNSALFIPRCSEIRKKSELDAYGALVLSAVGDGVHTLFLRSALSRFCRYRAEDLHQKVSEYARAEAQSAALKELLPLLTEEEKRVVNRGKNAHPHNVPKHATKYEYSTATAFEALTGYLYLSGEHDRLCELYDAIYAYMVSEIEISDTQTNVNKETQEGEI